MLKDELETLVHSILRRRTNRGPLSYRQLFNLKNSWSSDRQQLICIRPTSSRQGISSEHNTVTVANNGLLVNCAKCHDVYLRRGAPCKLLKFH